MNGQLYRNPSRREGEIERGNVGKREAENGKKEKWRAKEGR